MILVGMAMAFGQWEAEEWRRYDVDSVVYVKGLNSHV